MNNSNNNSVTYGQPRSNDGNYQRTATRSVVSSSIAESVKALGSEAASETAVVTQFVCKMNGSSEPFLAKADNGKKYVVKFAQESCANFLFNECLGSNLYRLFGLLSPPWMPLLLTDEFLDRNTDCWIERTEVRTRPPAGLCFGSQFLGDSETEVYQIIPESWFKRIYHPFDFWRAWFLDVCAEHYDARQALFHEREDRMVQPWFIDHGFMFGGPDHRIHRKVMAPRYLDSRIYGETPIKRLSTWVETAQALDQDVYWQLLDSIPSDWKTSEAMAAFARFIGRFLNKELGAIIIQQMDEISKTFLRLRSERTPTFHMCRGDHLYPAESEESTGVFAGSEAAWVD